MLTAMGDVMRRCYEKGWITTRDGNISVWQKGYPDRLYITPKGVRKNIIQAEHICKLPIETIDDQPVLCSDKDASTELHMHWNILREVVMGHGKTRSIVHVHPTHVVAALYAGFSLQKIARDFPEISRYTRVGPSVSAHPAGSPGLAKETYEKMTHTAQGYFKYDIVGQECHGVAALGLHPWDAYEHIERLDHICEIVLKSGARP